MKGLTCKEIKTRQNELYLIKYFAEKSVLENQIQPWTPEEETEMHELSFRSWINGCLIYSCDWKLTSAELQSDDTCTGTTTLDLYKVELTRALEIVEEQKERFKTAKILHNVYTDSEGCSYNSVDWD